MATNKIEYRKGDLFTAPKGVVLAHACNAQGSWNSGVAKTFKQHFPKAYELYHQFCTTEMVESETEPKTITFRPKTNTRASVGKAYLIYENDYRIGCLITSDRYGAQVDQPTQILQATRSALEELIGMMNDGDELHMPKINSVLFRTPWPETEKCIEYVLSNSDKDIKCVVWELD